jgi:hypothetical protein
MVIFQNLAVLKSCLIGIMSDGGIPDSADLKKRKSSHCPLPRVSREPASNSWVWFCRVLAQLCASSFCVTVGSMSVCHPQAGCGAFSVLGISITFCHLNTSGQEWTSFFFFLLTAIDLFWGSQAQIRRSSSGLQVCGQTHCFRNCRKKTK